MALHLRNCNTHLLLSNYLRKNIVKNHLSSLFIAIILLFLTACSSTALQSKRLNTAEDFIIQAEQALSRSPSNTQIRIADENLGTAHAYLATIYDQRKFLSKHELKRYQTLKQRVDGLYKRIR